MQKSCDVGEKAIKANSCHTTAFAIARMNYGSVGYTY